MSTHNSTVTPKPQVLPLIVGKYKRNADRGFTLIELIIVITILSVLMAIFLNRVEYYQELAEKTAMDENIGAIQNAVTMQYGKNYIRGNRKEISQLPSENPIKWLQKLPQNYAGEFFDPKPTSVAPGSWIFDLKAHELIYIPSRTEHFVPGKDGAKWIRFHIEMQYESIKRNGVFRKDQELVGSVFAPTEKVNWL